MYEVIWEDRALDELADAYVQTDAAGRAVIAHVVDGLNRRMAIDPHDIGESRGGNWRFVMEKPCAAVFAVDDARRRVRVTNFWTY